MRGWKLYGSFSLHLHEVQFLPSGLYHGFASFYVSFNLVLDFPSRESDGSFQYGYYWREAEDLRAVIQHFHESNRGVSAIVGHSKGILNYFLQFHLASISTNKKKVMKDKLITLGLI